MENNRMTGNTDKPILHRENDEFQISPYINGLSEFIEECETPMTVAIQGDWGCGKTSMMNMVKDYLAQNPEIISVWFNTWQFSQFNMDDQLAITFLQHLTKNLVEKLPAESEEKKAITSKMKPIMKSIAVGMTKHFIGSDIGEMVDCVMTEAAGEQKAEPDMADQILQLKENFEQLIEKVTKSGQGRVIIFIDDLDRLQPIRAVELLEVLKLFVDCENCVFVMAIDTSVVFQGIREKYGKDMSDEKAQSFFDKMIQLPFKMPVAYYKLDKMMGRLMDFLQDECMDEKERKQFVSVIRQVTGGNPRTLKRLANSILLVDKVALQRELYKEEDVKNQSFIRRILAILACIQLKYEPAYAFIVNNITYGHMKDILNLKFVGSNGARKTELIGDMKKIGMSDFDISDELFFFNLMHLFVDTSQDLIQRIKNYGETDTSAINRLIQIISLNNIKNVTDENISISEKEDIIETTDTVPDDSVLPEQQEMVDTGMPYAGQAMMYTGMIYSNQAMEAYRLLEQKRTYPNINRMNYENNEELNEFRKKHIKISETYLGRKIDGLLTEYYKREEKADDYNSTIKYVIDTTKYDEFKVTFREELNSHYLEFEGGTFSADMQIFEKGIKLQDEVAREYRKLQMNYGTNIFPDKDIEGLEQECDNEGELKKIRLNFPIVNEVLADLVTDFLVDIAREPRSVLRNNQGGMEGMMNAVLLSAGEPH